MRIFTACLGTETHTGAPLPTDMAAFEAALLVRGGNHPDTPHMMAMPLVLWREKAQALGWSVAEGLAAFATPSGPTVQRVYENLRDEILGELQAALPVDGVLLSLHGAMVADGYEDCEEDLVCRIRALAGPDVPIMAELDLHCHLTRAFMDAMTALVIYKEYPHTDSVARAEEVWDLMERTLAGDISPTMATFDCRMIGCFHTTREPMRSFVDRMSTLEAEPGILSVSLGHGFPWGDVPAEGARVVVVSDGDATQAASIAETLGRELWSVRHDIPPIYVDVETAITEALSKEHGPVVIADMSDNPGGGAPGDSTFIARRLLERGIGMTAIGGIWDPVAVGIATGAGEGAKFRLRLGGKTGATSGDPLDLDVDVRRVIKDARVSGLGGSGRSIGDAVWLHAEGIDFVVHSKRSQNVSPSFFEVFGIPVQERRILVVKSMQHFYAAYEPIAFQIIYCGGPGTIEWDMTKVARTKIARPVWPVDEDPWSSNAERPWF